MRAATVGTNLPPLLEQLFGSLALRWRVAVSLFVTVPELTAPDRRESRGRPELPAPGRHESHPARLVAAAVVLTPLHRLMGLAPPIALELLLCVAAPACSLAAAKLLAAAVERK